MANTLFDYYKTIGQNLPSIADRSALFASSGLGSAADYRGTAEQNTRLLAALQGGSSTPSPVSQAVSVPAAQTGTPVTTGGDTMAKYLPGAQSLYAGVYKPYEDILNQQLTNQGQVFQAQRENLQAAIPLNQQRYEQLLKELEAKDLETQQQIKTEGEAAIGETRARAGARGTFTSGIEQGQESVIGGNVAKLIKSQAEGTERNKQTYALNRDENENKIRGLLTDLASQESEQGFKIRQAIAAIGPDVLDKAITLSAQMMTDERQAEELNLSKEKFAFEKSQASKGTKSEQALATLRNDVANGATVGQIVAKYAGVVDGKVIADVYDAASPYGKMSTAEKDRLYGAGSTTVEGGATTADAISVIKASGTREKALQDFSANGSAWANAGADLQQIKNAVDAYYPPPATSTGGSVFGASAPTISVSSLFGFGPNYQKSLDWWKGLKITK